jgi:hypothetical protein
MEKLELSFLLPIRETEWRFKARRVWYPIEGERKFVLEKMAMRKNRNNWSIRGS